MSLKNRLIPAFLFFLFAFVACEDNTDCSSSTRSEVKVRFRALTSPEPALLYDRIYAIGAEENASTGATFYDNVYELPVNPLSNSTTFIFEGEDNLRDTIEVSYDVQYRIISELCGVELIYKDLEIKYSSFDSITVVTPIMTRQTEVNFEIIL